MVCRSGHTKVMGDEARNAITGLYDALIRSSSGEVSLVERPEPVVTKRAEIEFDGDIYVIDRALAPGQGDEFLYVLHGEVGLGKMMGRSLITSNGDSLEGSVLEEVITLGAVMFVIKPLYEAHRPTI